MTSTVPATRTEWVEGHLRDAILEGDLPPGTPLRAEDLARRWDVSPTPVREALRRLAGIGFVAWQPQRGARVAEATVRDVEEVYELRLLLEPVALRESLEHADAALVDAVAGAYREYERAMDDVTTAGPTELLRVHRAFHAALLARCPNGRMLETVERLAAHSQRFQVLALGAPQGHHDVVAEHRGLRDHVVAGRCDAAVEALTVHLQATLDGARAAAGQAGRTA